MVTAVDELVAFVRAALDRQHAALIALRDHRASEDQCVNVEGDDPAEFPFDPYGGGCAIHIRLSAAVVYRDVEYGLAEVEAKRRILDLAESEDWDNNVKSIVHLLAQPYAGHDGWREEWRA